MGELSTAQQVAAEISRTAKSQYLGLLFPVPVRLQLDTYALVEVLTHRAGVSRNKMLNRLIDAGLDSVLLHLDEDSRAAIQQEAEAIQQEAVTKNAGLMERGEV